MFQFEQPIWLYALPLLLLLALAAWRQFVQLAKRRQRVAEEELLAGLGVGQHHFKKRQLQAYMALLALACWVVALANPQFGTRSRALAVRSTELVLALDISESMLATDVQPSRLSRAQLFLIDLLGSLAGERVGLVLFAGEAYLQMPLTTDYGTAAQLIRTANPKLAATQGTNIGAALNLSRRLLVRPLAANSPTPVPARRLTLLISDGENHEADAEQAARQAAEAGIQILTVGVGTAAGDFIPSSDPRAGGLKRGASGEPVRTIFDPAALQALAQAGDGQYYALEGNTAALAKQIASYLDSQVLGGNTEELFEEAASYYQWFVGLGLLSLGFAWSLGRTFTKRT